MEPLKAGGFSSKVADSNLNGRDNKLYFFTRETKFKKRRATPSNVAGRKTENFANNKNYS